MKDYFQTAVDESAPFGFNLSKDGLRDFLQLTQEKIEATEEKYHFLKLAYIEDTEIGKDIRTSREDLNNLIAAADDLIKSNDLAPASIVETIQVEIVSALDCYGVEMNLAENLLQRGYKDKYPRP